MRPAGLAAAGLAAVAARLSYTVLQARPPGGEKTWIRTNHRGEPVSLLAGPAVAAGAVAGALLAPGLSRPEKAAIIVAGAGAAAFGGYDDLAGSGASKGFRGHLGALRHGEVTTGAVKLAGIGATGLAAAVLLAGERAGAGRQSAVATASSTPGWWPGERTCSTCSTCGRAALSRSRSVRAACWSSCLAARAPPRLQGRDQCWQRPR
jgi:hypothetical protein